MLRLAIVAEAFALANAFSPLMPIVSAHEPAKCAPDPFNRAILLSKYFAPSSLSPSQNGGHWMGTKRSPRRMLCSKNTIQQSMMNSDGTATPSANGAKGDAAGVAEIFPVLTNYETGEEDEAARQGRWRRQEAYMESIGATYALLWERRGDKFVATKDFTTDSRRRALRLVRADGKTL